MRWGGKGLNSVKVEMSDSGLLKSHKVKKFAVSANLMNADNNQRLHQTNYPSGRASNREFLAQFDTIKIKNFRFGISPFKQNMQPEGDRIANRSSIFTKPDNKTNYSLVKPDKPHVKSILQLTNTTMAIR